MKFGIILGSQHPETDDMRARFAELVIQVREARRLGFDSIWAGQHFLTSPLAMFQPIPLLARLAGEAEGMTIGTSAVILPLLNPVEIAETVATFDILTDGRFVFGVGLGFRGAEDAALGVNPADKVARFVEAITLIRRLWAEPEVTFEGKYFRVERARLSPRPIQRPHVPIWIAASVDTAVKRAAQIGDAWMITAYPSRTMLEAQLPMYREAVRAAGRNLPSEYPIIKDVCLAETTDLAIRTCREYIEAKYRSYATWGQDKFLPSGERFDQSFEEFSKDRFIVGDPETVTLEIAKYRKDLGVNHLICKLQWPGFPQELTLCSMRLMGQHVIPQFRS